LRTFFPLFVTVFSCPSTSSASCLGSARAYPKPLPPRGNFRVLSRPLGRSGRLLPCFDKYSDLRLSPPFFSKGPPPAPGDYLVHAVFLPPSLVEEDLDPRRPFDGDYKLTRRLWPGGPLARDIFDLPVSLSRFKFFSVNFVLHDPKDFWRLSSSSYVVDPRRGRWVGLLQ